MKCKKCGFECKDTDKFCKNCGEKIKSNKKYCFKCGNECNAEALYCPLCGNNFNAEQETIQVVPYEYEETRKCKFCLKEMPKKAKKCPHCGEWQEKSYGCLTILTWGCFIFGIIILLSIKPESEYKAFAETVACALLIMSVYCLPTFIAENRNNDSSAAISLVNFFLGWTIIGWFVALIWALASRAK